jgi:hypothetical protein
VSESHYSLFRKMSVGGALGAGVEAVAPVSGGFVATIRAFGRALAAGVFASVGGVSVGAEAGAATACASVGLAVATGVAEAVSSAAMAASIETLGTGAPVADDRPMDVSFFWLWLHATPRPTATMTSTTNATGLFFFGLSRGRSLDATAPVVDSRELTTGLRLEGSFTVWSSGSCDFTVGSATETRLVAEDTGAGGMDETKRIAPPVGTSTCRRLSTISRHD